MKTEAHSGRFRAVKKLWPWLCALLSGVLLGLSYPPASFGGLVWLALVPLSCAVWFSHPAPPPAWRSFQLGFATGAVYFLSSLHWLTTVTVAGWIALALYLATYPALWALFLGGIKPLQSPFEAAPVWMKSGRNLAVSALGAAAWTGLEWLRGFSEFLFAGFGWNSLGVALHRNIALIQITDLAGVGGLSFLVVMVNLMIVITVKRLTIEVGRHRLRPHYDFSLTVALVALAFAYGVRQLMHAPPAGDSISIAAIQSNIPIVEKRDPEHEERILDLHVRLSETAVSIKPDLLVWPEAATPRPLFSDQRNWDVVRGLAEKHDGDFLLGTVHLDPHGGDFNSVVLLSDHAKLAQFYHKVHLVPFGEYVPARDSFPFFAWIVGDLVPDDFDSGGEPVVLETKKKPVKIAPLICFEDTLGDLARQFVAKGAQLFITVTNDGWFLQSAGSEQHLVNAVFRCAENKIPMIRAANTGVSCVIDRFGRIVNSLQAADGKTFIEGVLFAHVEFPKAPPRTFYTRHGDIFSILCFVGAALFLPKLLSRKR